VTAPALREVIIAAVMSIEQYMIRFRRPAFRQESIQKTLEWIRELNDSKTVHSVELHQDRALLDVAEAVKAKLAQDYFIGLQKQWMDYTTPPDSDLPLIPVSSICLIVVNREATYVVYLTFRFSSEPEVVKWTRDVSGKRISVLMRGYRVRISNQFDDSAIIEFDPTDSFVIDQITKQVDLHFKIAKENNFEFVIEKICQIDTEIESIEDWLPTDVPATFVRIPHDAGRKTKC